MGMAVSPINLGGGGIQNVPLGHIKKDQTMSKDQKIKADLICLSIIKDQSSFDSKTMLRCIKVELPSVLLL